MKLCKFIPKNNGVEIKRIFNDACRRRSRPEDVLFGRQIIRSSYSLQVTKIAATNISMQHAANDKKDTDQLIRVSAFYPLIQKQLYKKTPCYKKSDVAPTNVC